MDGILYFKPDFEITIRLNRTQMHYGRLGFAYVYNADFVNDMYIGYPQLFQTGDYWQIEATTDQELKITVPYVAISTMLIYVVEGNNFVLTGR